MEHQVSFDTWTSLFLLVSSLGIFLAVILTLNPAGRKHNWAIILLILGFSLVLIQYVFIWTGYRADYPYVYFFDSAWFLAFGPLLYAYILGFYDENRQINRIHFALPVLVLLWSAFIVSRTEGLLNLDALKGSPVLAIFWQLKNGWLSIVSLLVYYLFIRDFLDRNHAEISTQEQQLRQKWIGFLMKFFLLFIVGYTSYYVLISFPFFNSNWDYAISMVMSIGIYGIGYMVFTEPQIFNGELLAHIFIQSSPNPAENELTDPLIDNLYEKLILYLEKEKPYLDNDIRLVSLADKIGFSAHLLSQIINQKSRKNFNQFINDYRLEEAERLLSKNEISSIKSI